MLKHLVAQIMKHTVVSRQHLTPEIALRLVTPGCSLWSAPVESSPFTDPYWAFYWPGGQATARYILDNEHVVKNRSVLDVGCGCGASSIAAAIAGAKRIVANDIDKVAVVAAEMNAELNGVKIEPCVKNLVGASCEEFDVVVVGDMFYDEDFAAVLFQWIQRLADDGKTVMVGDPGRHGLTASRRALLKLLATYQLSLESRRENNGFTQTTVWGINGS
ncbi:electron transfer flavoprotein beta subunit lysine methyltransferase-like [Battus philenor]|uniref:electron transfer flavoprotein beta subunit lysine methyltransferase-like n=1 Tax=Battus philenor TaxID=42288 RepID=UPI0035D0ACB2